MLELVERGGGDDRGLLPTEERRDEDEGLERALERELEPELRGDEILLDDDDFDSLF